MKRITSLILICLLCITSITTVSASSNNLAYKILVVDGKTILIDEEGYSHIFHDSNGNPLSPKEALEAMEISHFDETKTAVLPRLPVYPYQNKMQYSSRSTYKGAKVKVTSDVKGPCTLSFTTSRSFSESFSTNISGSASLKAMLVAEVKATLGVSWTKTTTISASQGIRYSVPKGKVGAIYFTPYYTQYNCTYFNSSGHASSVFGRSPKKTVGGFADGLFELVYK